MSKLTLTVIRVPVGRLSLETVRFFRRCLGSHEVRPRAPGSSSWSSSVLRVARGAARSARIVVLVVVGAPGRVWCGPVRQDRRPGRRRRPGSSWSYAGDTKSCGAEPCDLPHRSPRQDFACIPSGPSAAAAAPCRHAAVAYIAPAKWTGGTVAVPSPPFLLAHGVRAVVHARFDAADFSDSSSPAVLSGGCSPTNTESCAAYGV